MTNSEMRPKGATVNECATAAACDDHPPSDDVTVPHHGLATCRACGGDPCACDPDAVMDARADGPTIDDPNGAAASAIPDGTGTDGAVASGLTVDLTTDTDPTADADDVCRTHRATPHGRMRRPNARRQKRRRGKAGSTNRSEGADRSGTRVRSVRRGAGRDGPVVADGALPSELVRLVATSVDGVRDLPPRVEPLWPSEMGHVAAMSMSAVRRDGLIGQEAVRLAIDEQSHFVVVPNVTIPITERALGTVRDVGPEGLDGIDLTINGAVDHLHTPDLVVVDLRTSTGWMIEIKRGGRLGCQHRRRLIEDVAAGGLLVRDALERHGYEVRRGRSCALVLDDGGGLKGGGLKLPGRMGLTLRGFDERFGTRASALVSGARARHRSALCALLAPRLRAAANEVTRAASDAA